MKCPECGREAQVGGQFCNSCGADLTRTQAGIMEREPTPSPSGFPKEDRPLIKFIGWAVLFGMIWLAWSLIRGHLPTIWLELQKAFNS